MKFKFYAIVLLTVGVFGLFACKDKDGPGGEPCSVAWGTELTDELNAYLNAATEYYADTNNPAKCNAYKSAYQAYLNALMPYGDCATLAGSQRAYWQQAVDEAQAEIDDIDC